MATEEGFEGWAILEIMGHRRLGGFVRSVTIFGAPMCRIDVACDPPATQFYGGSAVFCMTPTTEEIARAAGKASSVAPVQRWELPQLGAPKAPPSERTWVDEDVEPIDDDHG